MPAKSRVSSWFSRRFKKHDSTALAPPSRSPGNNTGSLDAPNSHPPSSLSPDLYSQQRPLLPSGNTDLLDVPSYHAPPKASPPSSPRPLSISSTSPAYAGNSAGVGLILRPQYSTHHLDDSACGNNSLRNPGTGSPPQVPQAQASLFQGPSHVFGGAHNFVMNNPVFSDYTTSTDTFMEKLLQETIIGAEFDSSARDPPPRCHPGTRLAIIQRCLDFILQCHDEEKLRWVVGPAGVGKSAVLQMVTETAPDNVIFASIFLSINGRSDGKKTIITIAYQLAVKCGPYRQFIRDQINLDPSLLRKSLSVQFNKFIVEPFIFKCIFEPSCRFLVAIDGLDECNDSLTQQGLLELITNFCITYPTSPIAWLVASRPEPHITSFFDNPEVQPTYIKEQMEIDSDEACEDVQRYLREELNRIKFAHPTLRRKREWPLEHEFTKIASAAGGLFAYAATVIRYMGDRTQGGPAAHLHRILETIDATAKDPVVGKDHPMAQLDALYTRILSNVPDDVMIDARKLLLMSQTHFQKDGFRGLCNAVELAEDDAYDAISYLYAVLKIPEPDQADDQLSYYHKSFGDFLSNFERSGFAHNFDTESSQLCDRTSLKILEEVQGDGMLGGAPIELWGGLMKGHWDSISLSWPADERFGITGEQMRINLYTAVMMWVETLFSARENLFKSISCFHALTSRFIKPTRSFPFYKLQECAFDHFRDELVKLGKLKKLPLRAFDYSAICGLVQLRFTDPLECDIKVSDPWNTSCKHEKEKSNDFEQRQGWSTLFQRCYRIDPDTEDDSSITADENTKTSQFPLATLQQGHREWANDHTNRDAGCVHCSHRLERLFVDNSDLLATVFIDRPQMCYVEVSFVDPDDEVSEWRYRFLHSGRPSSLDT